MGREITLTIMTVINPESEITLENVCAGILDQIHKGKVSGSFTLVGDNNKILATADYSLTN